MTSVMDVPETVTEEMILALVEKKRALQVHHSALISVHVCRLASVLDPLLTNLPARTLTPPSASSKSRRL